jgi:predicted dehydrogenase
MIRVAIVGFGYWGPNLTRNFNELDGVEVAAICDTRPEALKTARARYPGALCTLTFDDIIADPAIDAVVIATPVHTHAPLAIDALRSGKHVLVTKPLASSVADAERIVEEAQRQKRVLLVDHTFVYMGAVRKVRDIIASGELGELYYFDSVRVNLGLYQHDVSVVWDLAVHDLSIIASWIPQQPKSLSCIGGKHLPGHPEDVAYLTLLYDDNLIAHMHVNWLSPVKVRRTLVGGSKKMILFDDLDPVEKIRVYDRGVTRRSDLVGSGLIPVAYRRTGDVWMPQFDLTEALRVEAAHFVECIEGRAEPQTDGVAGARVVRLLEAAEESMRRCGQLMPL